MISVYMVWDGGDEDPVYFRTLSEARQTAKETARGGATVTVTKVTLAKLPWRDIVLRILNGGGYAASQTVVHTETEPL